ncbi:hypothetical protein Psi02_23760 [Planotetraspora silvatica]|uniref:Uncharacterized protein n=1 Tax=Planotetraspora silvatica TaxID=234614 RepID=A0A8J3XL46_9ACTN|nr:class I SAM-dependent methyltransferase [Planotetraspora silvatica]GII45952.1 hypothetical protein Psi02_23760 [Planotetraspora silvatica]
MKDTPKPYILKLAAAVLLGTAIAITAVLGYPELATALMGVVLGALCVSVLRMGPRVGQQIRTQTLESRKLTQRIEATQRQVLAAAKDERAAERTQALITKLDDRLDTNLATQRRVLAALENERLAGADRQQELLTGLEKTQSKIEESITSMGRIGDKIASGQRRIDQNLINLRWELVRENEALLQLFDRFEPRAPMPPSGGWALNPTGLLELLFLVERRQPRLVVELGGGTSSIWIAYALEKTGGRVISMDHDHEYAARTRLMLQLHGLDHVVEVRDAPLSPFDIGGETFNWYGLDAFQGVDDIELLLVDGPPRAVGPIARYPALQALAPKLASRSTVILDDANRPEEQEVARRWAEEVPGLTRETAIFDRQAIFSYERPTAE